MLSGAERSLLEKAFVESYKKFTKAQKEKADLLIQAVLAGETPPKAPKKQPLDFETLEKQINRFIQNVQEGNYTLQRRLPFKRFIKELDQVKPDSEHFEQAVSLLSDLYFLASQVYAMNPFFIDDVYRSIGISQSDFYLLLAEKTFCSGYSWQNVASMARIACTCILGLDTFHLELPLEFAALLPTPDVCNIAIEECKREVQERLDRLSKPSKNTSFPNCDPEDEINRFCDLILILYIQLGEVEQGCKYYFKNLIVPDRQSKSEFALEIALLVGDDADWIYIYKYASRHGFLSGSLLEDEFEDEFKQRLKRQHTRPKDPLPFKLP